MPSEFVFVPESDSSAEDEGWLIGYVHDGTSDTSCLEILDAHDIERAPVARVDIPARIPAGFHGNWIPDRALR
jgi:carotenoid cleavage dioxygenase